MHFAGGTARGVRHSENSSVIGMLAHVTPYTPHPAATTTGPYSVLARTSLRGGDFLSCLSNFDIDKALATFLGARYVNALVLHALRTRSATVVETIKILGDALMLSSRVWADQWVVAPLHIRHHWCLALFTREHAVRTLMTVFDSAPSVITRTDIRRLARTLGVPLKISSPLRQIPGSNQCGLFSILYAMLAQSHIGGLRADVVDSVVVDLTAWRTFFAEHDVPMDSRVADFLMSAVCLPSHLRPLGAPTVGDVASIPAPETTPMDGPKIHAAARHLLS